MVEIDETDRRILRHLQRQADSSLESLGEIVGLSRNACWRRIRAMEERGIITGRVALLDPASVGLGQMVVMLIRTSRHGGAWLDDFAAATRAIPQIISVYRMSGDLDYLIRARVRDVADYDRLYQALIQRIELADVSASFVMEEIKETTELPL